MIYIEELKVGNRSYFLKTVKDTSDHIISQHKTEYKLFPVVKNHQTLWILYDDNMILNNNFFRFINNSLKDFSQNSVEQAAHAIRLLYCFADLFNVNIYNLSEADVRKLEYFLIGFSPTNSNTVLRLKTTRKNSTVNKYLVTYRSYLKSLGIITGFLFETKNIALNIKNAFDETVSMQVNKYQSNLPTKRTEIDKVPKYISYQEFNNIYEVINNLDNQHIRSTAKIIIRLMYLYGLRIGEVLGLTNEDLVEDEIDGELHPFLLIRNRISDKKYQKAKGCMNIVSKDQYWTPDYKKEDYGFQKVVIDYDDYEMICDYIDDCYKAFHKKEAYNSSTKADSVIRKNAKNPNNFYLFVNTYGKLLSLQTWNNYLRPILQKAGIKLDKDVRKNNINHRFRHGFAMYHILYQHTDIITLQKMMRHRSVESTRIYFNPTEEDAAKITQDFVDDLYNKNPKLKE